MGDFPSQSPDALLSLAWLERAQRDTRTYEGKVDIGIDVAGPGEDETVMWPGADSRFSKSLAGAIQIHAASW